MKYDQGLFQKTVVFLTARRDHGRRAARRQPVRIREVQSGREDQLKEHGYQLFWTTVPQTGEF